MEYWCHICKENTNQRISEVVVGRPGYRYLIVVCSICSIVTGHHSITPELSADLFALILSFVVPRCSHCKRKFTRSYVDLVTNRLCWQHACARIYTSSLWQPDARLPPSERDLGPSMVAGISSGDSAVANNDSIDAVSEAEARLHAHK